MIIQKYLTEIQLTFPALQSIQQSAIPMRKNISQIIVQVDNALLAPRRGSFKIPCKDIRKFESKILVQAKEYNTPSRQQQFVKQQMKEYGIETADGLQQMKKDLERNMQSKRQKRPTLDMKLTKLQVKFDLVKMNEVMQDLRLASRNELQKNRFKLIKIENLLSFKLESSQLASHQMEALNQFLIDLNEIINKTSKVY